MSMYDSETLQQVKKSVKTLIFKDILSLRS